MSFLREIAQVVARYALRIFWSVILCAKEIVRLCQDHYLDLRFGLRTCYDHTALRERSAFRDEIFYKPTGYARIFKMIEFLQLDGSDVFVDIGCGKGRAVALVSRLPVKKAVGLELRPELAEIAQENLSGLKDRKADFEILQGDAAETTVTGGTVYFMHDPFFFKTFLRVIENIRRDLERFPRPLRLVYFDERYADYLNAQDWLEPLGEIGHTRIFVWRAGQRR